MYKDLSAIARSWDCGCPYCGKDYGFFLGSDYEVDGEKYPKVYNDICAIDSTSWDELHKCPDCKNEFWFTDSD